MTRIKLLDKHTINQIAAGEVIERPSSVVKELVENSIDAGATKIEISISNDCRDIRVADNGSGIHPDDIELAFVKHATSKIRDDKDLYDIHSLGFRGEALASIISISKLTAISRTSEYDYGFKVECENSEVKKSQTGCAVGTIMQVKDLFYNLPVRLKFLKNTSTEFSYIAEISQLIALSNPRISIVLKHNNSEYFRTSGSGDLKTTICEIYTNSFLDKLHVVEKRDLLSSIKVTGFAASPDFTRSSRKSMITFINGRVVKCRILGKAIETAYKSMLPNNRYPFVVINVDIPTQDVDINVHPQKKEVRYNSTNQVFQFVMSAISQAISSPISFEPDQVSISESEYADVVKSEEVSQTKLELPESSSSKISHIFSSRIKVQDDDEVIYLSQDELDSHKSMDESLTVEENTSNIIDLPTAQSSVKSENYRIIGQYQNTYIIIEYEDGLELVDQHIADERYRFEKLMEEEHRESQILLFSDVIQVEHDEAELLHENMEELNKIGYVINFINDKEIIFKKIPQVVAHISVRELFEDIIKTMSDTSSRTFYENMLTSIACKASVKAGKELNMWQMEELISRWKTTKNPHTCPHGRPVAKKFTHNQIAGFFMRNE